jgi:hypothetical protein
MKLMFGLFAFLYMVSPLVVVPTFAYLEGNYYLLLGILFSYFASYTAISGQLKGFIYLFLLLSIGFWLSSGFSVYQYITFFFFCSLGGYLLAAIADAYDAASKHEADGANREEIEK